MKTQNLNLEKEWQWLQKTIHSPEYKNFSQMQKEMIFEFQLMLNSIYDMKSDIEKQLLIDGYKKLKQVF